MQDSRQLASIKKIDKITPIEGADKIECAHLGGWTVVVGKNEFVEGEEVIYFEIDSMLPLDRDEFSFLEPRGKTIRNDRAYHRLKTAKLRGQISQGLCMKATNLDIEQTKLLLDEDIHTLEKIFEVVKYEPNVPANLSGKVKNWPDGIEHTDECRAQNLSELFEQIKDDKENWIATEKIDGTSCTIWADYRGEELKYGVCSRNWGLEEDDENDYWKIAKEELLTIPILIFEGENNHRNYWSEEKISIIEYVKKLAISKVALVVVQGELFGEGIQKNPLGIKGHDFRIFNVVINGQRQSIQDCVNDISLNPFTNHWVPIHWGIQLPDTLDEVVAQPDGIKTKVEGANKDAQIEGFVWRHRTQAVINVKKDRAPDYSKIPKEKWDMVKASYETPLKASFKAISNKYLLKHE